MKNHRTTLAIVILVLMASTFHQEAAFSQPVRETSQADSNVPHATPSEWKEFSSRQGGFSGIMPGIPKEQTEVKEFPVFGKGETHLFILGSESGVYVATYVDVPGLARETQEVCENFGKGFLKGIGEATAKGAAGKVVKETDISFGKDPGREMLIELRQALRQSERTS